MLPASLISCELRGTEAHPRFLAASDRPWIRQLLERWERLTGRPVRQLAERLRELVAGCAADDQRLVAHLLLGWARSRIVAPLPPREARAAVFTAMARGAGEAPDAVLRACAEELHLSPDALGEALFADLPGERVVVAPGAMDPVEVALRANLLLAQALLERSLRVEVFVEGSTRAVVRYATLRGLLCTVTSNRAADGVLLSISGPFALFRRTRLYGRALGSLLPVLAWTRRFTLSAPRRATRPGLRGVIVDGRSDLPFGRAAALRQPGGGAVRSRLRPRRAGLGDHPGARARPGR